MKKLLKRLLSQNMRDWLWDKLRSKLNLAKHLYRDYRRFNRHNLMLGRSSIPGRVKSLMMCTHIIEKGLALRETKPFFGKDVIVRVVNDAIELSGQETVPSSVVESACEAVGAYLKFNENQVANDQEAKFLIDLTNRFKMLDALKGDDRYLSTILKSREGIKTGIKGSVSQAIYNRHSLRMFSNSKVDMEAVERAIIVAQRSPSACNLQPVRLTVFKTREMIDKALAIQSGARGFYSEVQVLFVVSFELGLQIGPRSRNQGYTDGGLFSQSLMLALLDEGIGSCPLNWAQEIKTDEKLRQLVKLPDSENVVMLIAAGNLPESFEVAGSRRIDLEAVRRFGD